MADDKVPAEIETPEVKKSFDPKMGKLAAEKLAASLNNAVAAAKGIKVVGKASAKEKGFQIKARITELTLDDKKGLLSIKAEIEVNTLPGPNLSRAVKGSSGFDGVNMKKLDKDVADLVTEMMKKTGPAVTKALEDKLTEM